MTYDPDIDMTYNLDPSGEWDPIRQEMHYSLFSSAEELAELRHFKEALNRIDEALVIAPDSCQFHSSRAEILYGLRRRVECRVELETAIGLVLKWPSEVLESTEGRMWLNFLYGSLARTYYHHVLGRFAKADLVRALAALQKAVEFDPSDFNSTLWMGYCMNRLGMKAGAVEAAERAMVIDPNAVEPHEFLCGIALCSLNLPLAYREFTRARQILDAETERLSGK
jgi:tetratricopeptide (TPR) repeat protein